MVVGQIIRAYLAWCGFGSAGVRGAFFRNPSLRNAERSNPHEKAQSRDHSAVAPYAAPFVTYYFLYIIPVTAVTAVYRTITEGENLPGQRERAAEKSAELGKPAVRAVSAFSHYFHGLTGGARKSHPP